MPEFILNDRAACETTESPFVLGFIEAMFFTECASGISAADWFSDEMQEDVAEGRADGTLPGDVGYSDLHPDALTGIRNYCEAFQAEAAALLAEAYQRADYDETQAGRDLWFTVNGHGVGYWDRDQLADNSAEYERLTALMIAAGHDSAAWHDALRQRDALKAESLGERLSKACGRGEINPYFDSHCGASGRVHVDF